MAATTPLPVELAENARQKLARGERLSTEEAQALKASLDPAEVAKVEAFFGMPIEELWEAMDMSASTPLDWDSVETRLKEIEEAERK